MEAKVKKQSVPWYPARWGLIVAVIAMTIVVSGLLLGACNIKKIGLLTGEECDANEQCLSNNCAAQGSKSTCQPVGSTKVCNTGNTQSCICSDGKAGNQICDATGLSWGLCTCTFG